MKIHRLLLVLPFVFALAACEQKPESTADKVKETVNDALDRRPNEKLHDAAEDVSAGVKSAVEDLKESK